MPRVAGDRPPSVSGGFRHANDFLRLMAGFWLNGCRQDGYGSSRDRRSRRCSGDVPNGSCGWTHCAVIPAGADLWLAYVAYWPSPPGSIQRCSTRVRSAARVSRTLPDSQHKSGFSELVI